AVPVLARRGAAGIRLPRLRRRGLHPPLRRIPGGSGRRRVSLPRSSGTAATFVRFLLVGGLNTLASLGVYWLLLPFMRPQPAYAASFVFGVGLGYLLHT